MCFKAFSAAVAPDRAYVPATSSEDRFQVFTTDTSRARPTEWTRSVLR